MVKNLAMAVGVAVSGDIQGLSTLDGAPEENQTVSWRPAGPHTHLEASV